MARVQTTQATGKFWKFFQLIGTLAIIAGGVGLIMGMQEGGTQLQRAVAGLGLVLGFPCYIAGRVGGWWFHG